MGSINNLRAALTQAFVTGAFFTQDKVAWENMAFDPPANAPWARCWFMPNQPTVATLGTGGEDNVNGIFQIDLNYPLNSGTAEIETKFDAIKAIFGAGSRYTYSTDTVVCKSCGRSSGKVEGSYFRVAVTVMFYAHINR